MKTWSLLLPLSFVLAAASPAQTAPHPLGGRLPDFIKVDGVYVFDGNEDDLIKVLEVPKDTQWVRVQTKAGESWVNLNNITTVTPISREAALKTEMKEKADFIRDGAMAISAAIDEYAAKHDAGVNDSFKWEDIRKFLKPNTPVYNSSGKDVTGRPYLFGAKIQDHVKVNADTIKECSPVIEDADAYWGKFKP